MNELNQRWGLTIVDTLVAQGIDTFVLSPGSRSTPLALALSLRNIRPSVHVDERAAGFFALGVAKATGRPAVLVCSSGSAVANYFPAVVEASQSYVPLVVLSADRPPELWDCQANQAINQRGIFTQYVRHDTQLPTPSSDVPPGYVSSAVSYAISAALGKGGVAGPAHINCSFREPFVEQALLSASDAPCLPAPLEGATQVYAGKTQPEISGLLSILKNARGAIVVGQTTPDEANGLQNILSLAKHWKWPILPDIASGLRFHKDAMVINYADQCLLEASETPDVVLWFGGPVVSKRINAWMTAARHLVRISPVGECVDPWHKASHHIVGDLALTAHSLQEGLASDEVTNGLLNWQEREQNTLKVLEEVKAVFETSEAHVVCTAIRNVPSGWSVFLGNSMPIRDADMYGPLLDMPPSVFVNRGASGIDGNIATVAGIATGTQAGVVAVLGDLTTLHDLTSLGMLSQMPYPVKLVVINNDGGGIFSFLPLAAHMSQGDDPVKQDDFKALWNTPHGMTFESAAKQFDLAYHLVDDNKDLTSLMSQGGSALLEVRIDREHNVKAHNQIQNDIRQCLKAVK